MKIGGFIPSSLLDYPHKVCCVVFTQGCNFHCPYCHNPELVPFPSPVQQKGDMEKCLEFLEKRKGLLDAVVISGGEPTLQKGLVSFLSQIKRMGYLVKLDTNGSRPQVLRSLLAEGFVDFVAMDIKTSPSHYSPSIACDCAPDILLSSMDVIMTSAPDYEFRTTCVRPFISSEVIQDIAQCIHGARRYALQSFRAKDILDSAFFTEDNPGHTQSELESFKELALPHVTECVIR